MRDELKDEGGRMRDELKDEGGRMRDELKDEGGRMRVFLSLSKDEVAGGKE